MGRMDPHPLRNALDRLARARRAAYGDGASDIRVEHQRCDPVLLVADWEGYPYVSLGMGAHVGPGHLPK